MKTRDRKIAIDDHKDPSALTGSYKDRCPQTGAVQEGFMSHHPLS